jgi:hypothetical protein
MIYAAIKFLQEWASPLTVVNYFLLGTASGFGFATAYAAIAAPELVQFYGGWAITLTIAGLLTRAASCSATPASSRYPACRPPSACATTRCARAAWA